MNPSTSSLRRLRDWWHRCSDGQPFIFVLAVLTGVAAGAAAAALKWVIGWISEGITRHFDPAGPNWALLVVPVAGIMLCGWYQRRVLRADLTHGVSKLGADLRAGRYALPGYLCYGPGVASSLTLGFGGSAGSEGPIAYTGAAIGSNVARLFRMDSHITMILLGCGAGAGIAGIFKAPIGGFLFTLEVLRMELTTMSVVACLLACVASAMTAYMLSGFTVDLTYIQELPMEPRLLPVLALLGIVCGLYSLYYGYIMRRMQQFYESIHRAWVRNLVSGLVLAALLFLFPALYGEGYGLMRHILQGDIAALSADGFFASATAGGSIALVAAGILAVKAFACSASNSGGGVAGDFAPTLYAGCVLGFLFATVAGLLCPDSPLPVAGFAFCGMAGVMSGVLQAPLMALFLTAEMTDANVLFLPLLIVSTISFGIIRLFRPAIYYTTV